MMLLLYIVLVLAAVFVLTKFILSASKPSPTHGGGVVIKRNYEESLVLLVSSKKTGEWVLPKGHIDRGETPEETAVREVREETGYDGKVIAFLGETPRYNFNGERILVSYFLMSAANEQPHPAEDRKKEWVPIHKAIDMVKREELKTLLRKAAGFLTLPVERR